MLVNCPLRTGSALVMVCGTENVQDAPGARVEQLAGMIGVRSPSRVSLAVMRVSAGLSLELSFVMVNW